MAEGGLRTLPMMTETEAEEMGEFMVMEVPVLVTLVVGAPTETVKLGRMVTWEGKLSVSGLC